MSKFSIGEIVTLVKGGKGVPDNIEVQIVSTRYIYASTYGYDIIVPGIICDSEDSKNGEWFSFEIYLRKKQPPQELSSWDDVQDITGWNPTKKIWVVYDFGIEEKNNH